MRNTWDIGWLAGGGGGGRRDLTLSFPLSCAKMTNGGRLQSRQSAKLFLQSPELGLPQPLTRMRVCPLPFGSGGSDPAIFVSGLLKMPTKN